MFIIICRDVIPTKNGAKLQHIFDICNKVGYVGMIFDEIGVFVHEIGYIGTKKGIFGFRHIAKKL